MKVGNLQEKEAVPNFIGMPHPVLNHVQNHTKWNQSQGAGSPLEEPKPECCEWDLVNLKLPSCNFQRELPI